VHNDIIINVFPGANAQQRLVLAQTSTICGLVHLVLRQESHSPDVGWFVQNQVAIESEQVASLKMSLSPAMTNPAGTAAKASSARVSRSAKIANRHSRSAESPVLLRFDAAG
jgi:hypothetical protein